MVFDKLDRLVELVETRPVELVDPRPVELVETRPGCRFSPNLSVSHYLVAGVSFSQYLVGLEESGAWVVLPPC